MSSTTAPAGDAPSYHRPMTGEQTWIVPLRGEPTAEAAVAVQGDGGRLTGLSHSTSSGGSAQHGFSVLIDAPTAREAERRLRAAVEGLGVHVPDGVAVEAVSATDA